MSEDLGTGMQVSLRASAQVCAFLGLQLTQRQRQGWEMGVAGGTRVELTGEESPNYRQK